jgi:anti-sigma factor (TIGR02949 family)
MTAFWNWGKRKGKDEMPEIDCGGVMAQLYEYIDEEIEDAETVSKIRDHLDLCKRCHPRFDFERAFLRFLGQQGRVGAPPELKRRIFDCILKEEGQG